MTRRFSEAEISDALERGEAIRGIALEDGPRPRLDPKHPLTAALLVLGDMSVQGNVKPLRSLAEPIQVAMDNGVKRALIPIENKRNFLDV